MLDQRQNDLEAELLAAGHSPGAVEAFPLRDWCNVGERMLIGEVSDVLALDIFRRLFAAETEREMEDAMAELVALSESYAADMGKALAELRAKRGVVRMVPQADLDAAMAEYGPKPSPGDEGAEG